MREAVINLDGVLHYALRTHWDGKNAVSVEHVTWLIYCDVSAWPLLYEDADVVRGRPTCVQCLGLEALRGKDLEAIEVPCR